jgi:hypothetical protein
MQVSYFETARYPLPATVTAAWRGRPAPMIRRPAAAPIKA